MFNMASSAGASGCEFELIDKGRLRVCFCEKCDCFLGGGTYGKVFKATATVEGEEGAVAIKCPSSECQVKYEIAVLQKLKHRNILKYHRDFTIGIHRYVLYLLFIIMNFYLLIISHLNLVRGNLINHFF